MHGEPQEQGLQGAYLLRRLFTTTCTLALSTERGTSWEVEGASALNVTQAYQRPMRAAGLLLHSYRSLELGLTAQSPRTCCTHDAPPSSAPSTSTQPRRREHQEAAPAAPCIPCCCCCCCCCCFCCTSAHPITPRGVRSPVHVGPTPSIVPWSLLLPLPPTCATPPPTRQPCGPASRAAGTARHMRGAPPPSPLPLLHW